MATPQYFWYPLHLSTNKKANLVVKAPKVISKFHSKPFYAK